MYYYLIGALRRRLILELQDSFSRHPVYKKIVPSIQNKFSFTERPHFGIVVKGSSANKVPLAGDNYIGQVHSHVMLAYVGQPQFPIEWVREDLNTVRTTGAMPTPPGVYYIEILQAPTTPGGEGYFVIDPLLTVTDEPVLHFSSGIEHEGQLQAIPTQGTVRLYENGRFLLKEGTDYTVNYTNGKITFSRTFSPNSKVSADYRYASTSVGPIPFTWNSSNSTALPGVIMAFGKRAEEGQKVAVVVYQDRVQAAEAFGGKFEVNFDLDVLATDTTQLEEIADLTMMYLWGQKKSVLELEGIEVLDCSIGGESEEPIDETGKVFLYSSSVSIQLRADWEIHVPMPLTISKVTPMSGEGLTATNRMQTVLGQMFYGSYPLIAGRNADFERIT